MSELAASAAAPALPSVSVRRLLWRRFLAHRLAVASGVVLAFLCLLALAAPLIEAMRGIDSNAVDLLNRFAAPSPANPLGTDELGRDLLQRLMAGGRVSLALGLVAAVAAATIGTTLGLLAGYFGGRLDALLMRIADGVIALPVLPLLIVLAAIDLTKLGLSASVATAPDMSFYRMVALIALVGWTTTARLVRGATLSVREREYVRAAVALGAGPLRIMAVHILPNVIGPVIVATTLSVGGIILTESVLSFLGLGIQPPLPSWGNMLKNAQDLIWSAPWLAIFPGVMIFITILCINFMGDALRDALDPHMRL